MGKNASKTGLFSRRRETGHRKTGHVSKPGNELLTIKLPPSSPLVVHLPEHAVLLVLLQLSEETAPQEKAPPLTPQTPK